jgi:hypothetical protein
VQAIVTYLQPESEKQTGGLEFLDESARNFIRSNELPVNQEKRLKQK